MAERTDTIAAGASTYPCGQCGAELRFEPGTTELACPYCQARTPIALEAIPTVREIDYERTLRDLAGAKDTTDRVVVHCDSCGADVQMPENVTSRSCCFCGSRIVATARSQKLIKPEGVIPFAVPETKARELFRNWLKTLWFAPSELKRFAQIDASGAGVSVEHGSSLSGTYVPLWTFDARSVTPYSGQRGDNYTDYETVRVMVNGRPSMQRRAVTKVRWSPRSGVVRNAHDDVLVRAGASLPPEHLSGIADWKLAGLVPYRDDYLSGFGAESYSVGLEQGFGLARKEMELAITLSVRADIGGDHQRITSMSPSFSEVTFKHLLAPVWVSAYRYKGKVYRFLVNGQTGTVSGQRPYSAIKIALASFVGVALLLLVVLILTRQ